MRAYSMVNHAEETHRLSLVIKRKPGGGFGDWLFDAARVGRQSRSSAPSAERRFIPRKIMIS